MAFVQGDVDPDGWAQEHRYLIQAAWQQMVDSGEWPQAEELMRAFFAKRRRVDVSALAARMPPALGRLDAGRVVLTVRGASHARGAKSALRLYVGVVVEALRRWRLRDAEAGVGERELAALGIDDDRQRQIFECILQGESWALLHQYDEFGRALYVVSPHAALALGGVKSLPKYLGAQAKTEWLAVRPPPANPLVQPEWLPQAPPGDLAGLEWLHPAVRVASEELLAQGHRREAVGRAVLSLMDELRRLAGSKKDGKALVNLAFSEKRPRVVIADRRSESGESLQRGTHLLFQGLVAAIRNPGAHRNLELQAAEAVEQLAVISFLYRQLDQASERRQRARQRATKGGNADEPAT